MSNEAIEWEIRTALVSVHDLDQSSEFYREVMNLNEIVRKDRVAVLQSEPSGTLVLFLRLAEPTAARSGQQSLGVRALSVGVQEFAELDRIEDVLRRRNCFRDRRPLIGEEPFEFVRGHDPDRNSLVFAAYKHGKSFSVDHYLQAVDLMYALDL